MKNRREFLLDLGIALGAITIARNTSFAGPGAGSGGGGGGKQDSLAAGRKRIPKEEVDFRYAPGTWQSTYCFPDDPYKSLVGKRGELLIGHPGTGGDLSQFPHVVSVGLKDRPAGSYLVQKLEAPGIPIITTKLSWEDLEAVLTSFATNDPDEGRVDNLLVEFRRTGTQGGEISPEIRIVSKSPFSARNVDDSSSKRDHAGVVTIEGSQSPFLIADSEVELSVVDGINLFRLQPDSPEKDRPASWFIRFPQADQPFEKLKRGLGRSSDLMQSSRAFWKSWSPFGGRVDWKLPQAYQDFLVASSRNIAEAREIKKGKKVFEVGPTVYRGLWVVDGASA